MRGLQAKPGEIAIWPAVFRFFAGQNPVFPILACRAGFQVGFLARLGLPSPLY
jgi:hypothetical protein